MCHRLARKWPTNRAYVDHFYRDEYQHGLAQRGPEFITMSRSIDNRLYPHGFAPLDGGRSPGSVTRTTPGRHPKKGSKKP